MAIKPFHWLRMTSSMLGWFWCSMVYLSYPLGIHIHPTITIKFMPDKVVLRFPPLDLWKKKGKMPPYTKPMPHPGLRDNIALHPIPYDWGRCFMRDEATKTVALKQNIQFDQNNIMLFYFKDMYENLCLMSTSEYYKENTSNHKRIVMPWNFDN